MEPCYTVKYSTTAYNYLWPEGELFVEDVEEQDINYLHIEIKGMKETEETK